MEAPVKDNYFLSDSLKNKFNLGGAALAVVGLGIGSLGYFIDHHRFWFSFHVAFLFLATITLGAIAFLAINYVTRTYWHVVVRRFAEHLSMNIFLIALMALVIMIFGSHDLYHHWMEAPPDDAILAGKAGYLNIPFFNLRTALYFAIWIGLAVFLCFNSYRQDHDGDYRRTQIMQRVSTVGVILLALTLTFASFDWIMSMDPHWFSTMFGVYFFAGCLIAIHTTLIIIKHFVHTLGYLKNTVTTHHDHDLGKYSHAYTVFWAYIGFSQFMLIWYANIPEETIWFHHRWEGTWKCLSLLLIFGKFVFPFLALMSRHVKKSPILLFAMAIWVLTMHYADLYWQVMPVFSPHGIPVDPQGLLVDVMTLGGFCLAYKGLFLRRLGRTALVPTKDPRLEASLKFENF